jgi:hypothetical protein
MKRLSMKRLSAVEGALYAVRDKKNRWIPGRYCGYDGTHVFLGIGENSGIFIDTIEDDTIRRLSPEAEQRFVELEAAYWRGHHANLDHIKRWLDEQRRIQQAAALCQTRGRLILMTRSR